MATSVHIDGVGTVTPKAGYEIVDGNLRLKAGWEIYEGRAQRVVNSDREGWWRFHQHYDRNGYCDNPGRGY